PQKIYGRPLVCLASKLSKKTSESKSQALIKEQFRVAMKGKYNLEDGLDCIEREADLSEVYVGSTKETCKISEQIIDRFVILVDDEYVANLHEDIIQALFEKGAKDVLLYTLANVIKQPSPLW
ncbi:MAG: hypothetical protein Q4A64_04320, partial [Porphyromonadaceae bacterium]|nr:hypothetical protein [Porphyromonadaceae bacterium]